MTELTRHVFLKQSPNKVLLIIEEAPFACDYRRPERLLAHGTQGPLSKVLGLFVNFRLILKLLLVLDNFTALGNTPTVVTHLTFVSSMIDIETLTPHLISAV